MPVKLWATPMDCVCMCHGELAVGVTGASVMGVTGVVDLAVQVAGKGMDVMSATSLVTGTSGLMASG